jgi:hypothetical protein
MTPAVDYERMLVEAAVLEAVRGQGDESRFLRERASLYEIGDARTREEAFAALHGGWFSALGLDRPLTAALAERPELARRSGRCFVARAATAADEAAELLVTPAALPTIAIRLRAATLAAPDRCLGVLRHEMLHLVDMLSPDFGYEPKLPRSAGGPLTPRRLTDRYRVLWDACVDGRLVRAGLAPPEKRAARLDEFRHALPELDETVFDGLFDAVRCTHAELVALASGVAMTAGAPSGSGP